MSRDFVPPSRFAWGRDEEEGTSGALKIKRTSTADFTKLDLNTKTVITDSPDDMELVFTLESPSDTVESRYKLTFIAGENTSMVITPPAGYVLDWENGEPEWTAGVMYELLFISLEKAFNAGKVISVMYASFEEA